MPELASASKHLRAAFERIVGGRKGIVLAYALVVPAALFLALRIPTDNAIERMIVESDPDYLATRAFQQVFPEKPSVLLLAESDDPFAPESLSALFALEAELSRVPRVAPLSALTIAERLRPGLPKDAQGRAELKRLLTGTPFFRRQALLGDHFLGLALSLDVKDPKERDLTLAGVERVLRESKSTAAFSRIRRLGEPFVDSYLEAETRAASATYFPLFGAFVVALNLLLYRSWRTLLAIIATLGVSVLLGTSVAAFLDFSFSIVSSLVPLTLMITSSASLIYLHSRFVDRPADVGVDEHQVFALANKFLAVTVSIGATAIGFAALSVSQIRPVREMGIWTAAGLVVVWAVSFTLFPALQKLLRTPTRAERKPAGDLVRRAADFIPGWSYRWRWPLVCGALGLSAAGAVSVLGWPGLVRPMPLETDSLDYVDARLPLHQDTRAFERDVSGLTRFSLWIETPPGTVVAPSFLRALDDFAAALEQAPGVGAVSGLPSFLRLRRYAAGKPLAPPPEGAALEREAQDLEQLLVREAGLRAYVDAGSLAAARLDVLTAAGSRTSVADLRPALERLWTQARSREPVLAACRMRVVGQGLLADKMGSHLVPTLVESFAVTAAVIFLMFFLVFRSGAARLMAMVPSLFAILVMFLAMRVCGVSLNVATILIATTVLGATENDQVHFFYHFQEKRRLLSTEEALRHAIRVAGSAILFATLVNAGGFLALALSDLPPMRQFGGLTSTAFVLSMLADFTALPAALWIVFRARPDAPGGGPRRAD